MNEDKRLDAAFPTMKRAKKSTSDDVEMIDLDVTPIMNLFMVLIPFLVSMAVFTQLAIVDFSLPPSQSEGGGAEGETKELDISIVITPKGYRVVGTGRKLDLVPTSDGSYQYEALRVLLKEIKFQYPSQRSVVLVMDGDVLYEDMVRFMDVCRESQFPDIGLSGEIG